MDDENKIADPNAAFYAKQARQQLKMQCIDMASRKATSDMTAADIVTNAKAFYAFARS